MSARSAKSSLPSPWRDPVILLAVPAVVYLLVVYAYPLLWLLMKSFTGPSGPTVQPYIAFMSDLFNWRVIGNTLRVVRVKRTTRSCSSSFFCSVISRAAANTPSRGTP